MAATVEGAQAGTSFAGATQALALAPSRVWARVDRFLGPQLPRFSPDELRRARLAVAVCAAIVLLAAVSTTNLILHGVWQTVPITVGVLVLNGLVALLLRRTGSLLLAGHGIAGVLAAALVLAKLNTGALGVPPFIWLPGIPLLATLIAGPWAGALWGAFAFAELGVFYTLASRGLEPAIELDPGHLFRGRYMGSAIMVVFVLVLGQAYERLKNRALDEMSRARRLAEARSLQVEETRRQQLELKDRLLSHVSHELRTPLAALHQFLSIVLDGLAGELGKEQREYLAIAFRNAEQLRHMIDDLMDLNRARNGKLRVESDLVALGPVLLETVRGLGARAAEKRLRLETRLPEALSAVQGDATRVRQVLGNLVENAIKFTPENGRIEVAAATDADDAAFLRVSVRDTGCGIDARALDRIFDRLHQEQGTEAESRLGLGLGLPIAKELVIRQGGRIWVESQLGRGSAFHFTLPIFSLARSLRACLVEDGRLRESFSVVRVELRTTDGRAPEGLRRGILHLLRSTVFYPEKDVVLPPGAGDDGPDRFTVLAATGAEGVKALVKRLQLRLERFMEERGRDDAVFRVEAHTEAVPEALARRPQDEALEMMADRVAEILRGAGAGEGEIT